ncbi:hypothetical protein [Arenimonas sp.]|uniref:DUF7665 family protein n=1 Tax=Arenimonas sp. TaxID=1872635 RepID=UPI0025C3103C|nr:hypothetical protein [Arenimonas sp.]
MASLDQQAFEADVESGAFLNGSLTGRWEVQSVQWPHAFIWVRAGNGNRLLLRFELTNYPRQAPTAEPWDIETNAPLAPVRWPRGDARVTAAFNPNWNAHALYIPCDRVAIQGHEAWRHQHPSMLWDPAAGIHRYVRVVSDLLGSPDYACAH